MNSIRRSTLCIALATVFASPWVLAASLSDLGGLSNALPGTLSSDSAGNVAGVLEYCVKNNYLNADSASSVKDKLLSKVTGGTSDSGYSEGSEGTISTSSGNDLSLSGLKEKVKKQACDQILKQGKSLI
ncbi:DUF2501 domain-containing protein [Pseudomonas monteilii]|uniref:DUF2501 domain-containing protein n=1 Tax=Pseudomonas monteilii TaxID=76759 RepID=UPI0018A8FBA9|nr:DUF2501 domain-containing protein [Pseudomonas monteilii]MBF8747112.1 DUF2501 domain-containing protein [Pseudomonas monteilii]